MIDALRIVAAIAIAYGLIVAAACTWQRRLIYFPDQNLPEPIAVGVGDMTPVTLHTDDGLDLVAWHHAPPQSGAATIVYFHGNASHIANRAPYARRFIDEGFGVLLLEYRGYGGNPGTPDEVGLYADAHAAIDWLKTNGIATDHMIIFGESLGAAVAVDVAQHYDFALVALQAPFTSLPDVGARAYPWLPVHWLTRDQFASIDKIGAARAPVLVIHCMGDRIVPFDMGEALFAAAPEPKASLFVDAPYHTALDLPHVMDSLLEHLRAANLGIHTTPTGQDTP